MNCRLMFGLAIAVLGTANASVTNRALAGERSEVQPSQRHALLIGVTSYPNLPASNQLRGPANDVQLLRKVLCDRLGFTDRGITELTDSAGATSAQHIPNRQNIETAVRSLIERVHRGDYVVIYLAGHGSQKPADETSIANELDGMDEVFLPRDAQAWDPNTSRLPNAIVDDELEAWIAQLQAKETAVCLLVDSCHSGTMMRGPGDTVRQVSASTLKIPEASLAAARKAARKRHPLLRGGKAEDSGFAVEHRPGVVALYACQPEEVTIEHLLPGSMKGAEPHGLFSYIFCQALTQSLDHPSQPLTYRELVGRMRRTYTAMGRDTPSPLLEGPDADREVFANQNWPGRSGMRILPVDRVSNGALQGLTEESVLSIHKDELSKEPIAYARVVEARVLESDILPCASGASPAVNKLPSSGFCRIVSLARGSEQLRVSIDKRPSPDSIPTAEQMQLLADVLARSAADGPVLIELVDDASEADWFVRPSASEVTLLPANRWELQGEVEENPAYGPLAWDGLETNLKDYFSRIARATNLVRIATSTEDSLFQSEEALSLGIKLSLQPSAGHAVPLNWQDGSLEIFDCDDLALEVTNSHDDAMHVSVLFVDSQYGVHLLFPRNGEDQQLRPGDQLPLEFRSHADTVGREHLIVIGQPASGTEPIDFGVLCQPQLEKLRCVQLPRSRGGNNDPLANLVNAALLGRERLRGAAEADLKSYFITAIPWTTSARTRPE